MNDASNAWTWAGAHVDGLEGQGLYFISPTDTDVVVSHLEADGWQVHRLAGAGLTSARAAREAIVATLSLEPTGANNTDALADSLSDLAPPAEGPARVAVVWESAEALLREDLPGWTELVGLLAGATAELWDAEDDAAAGNVVFETLLVVDGFGVEPLGTRR